MIGLTAAGLSWELIALAQGQMLPATGSVLLLLAAAGGLMSAVGNRADVRSLTDQLQAASQAKQLDHIKAPSHDFASIAAGMNAVLTAAEKSVSEATLKTKELEIQLKVANAERQHA